MGGNNWGVCPDGIGKVGCGPQEEFRACSDIAIGARLVGGEVTTARNPPTMATSNRPWLISTTARPWWLSTTRRPWWASTTRKPWWMTTTRKPWWAATTRKPWWKSTTRRPWWASTPRTQSTTKTPWWSATSRRPWSASGSSWGSWSWNSWTPGNGRGLVDENKVWLRSGFPGLGGVQEEKEATGEVKSYEEMAASWAEHLLRGLIFFFDNYVSRLFSQSRSPS